MPKLRFAEAVCPGHPDALADAIADGLVRLACARDAEALVGIEVAVHRKAVFVDGRIAAGEGRLCAVSLADVERLARRVYREAGYGTSPAGFFAPDPAALRFECDLDLGPLGAEERAVRGVSDDQAICVGHAVAGARAGFVPLEQALARDFAGALVALRRARPELGLGPDGKALVAARGQQLVGVSLSVHHGADSDWSELTRAARAACEGVAGEYVAAGELQPLRDVDWLVNGAGAFEVGGPLGDNGLSGKKLVAQAYGSAVPIGGGAVFGKDPRKVDPRGQARARQVALELVQSGRARAATVWLAFRPGDTDPRWVEVETTPSS